jgi:hypothetical protein
LCEHRRVGNCFSADGSSADCTELYLSNGGTDVFFDVLTLAGCDLAETPWQQNLILHFADGHRHSRGLDGFDLSELPWTSDWRSEKAFVLRVIETAAKRHGWDRLAYDPPHVADYLATYEAMLAGFTPVPVDPPAWGDWTKPPSPDHLTRCPSHHIYQGTVGCRLCDTSIQPTE